MSALKKLESSGEVTVPCWSPSERWWVTFDLYFQLEVKFLLLEVMPQLFLRGEAGILFWRVCSRGLLAKLCRRFFLSRRDRLLWIPCCEGRVEYRR